MIPMRQLHTPVYNRNKLLASIGSEEAVNAIGVEFTKYAPELITELKTAFDKEDYDIVQLISLKLATLAHSSGATQISEFAKTIFKEVSDTTPNKDTIAIALACIKTSYKEFVILLSQFTQIS